MGMIRLDEIMTSIVDSYKRAKQWYAEHGTSATNMIIDENAPGGMHDGDSHKKSCLKGGHAS